MTKEEKFFKGELIYLLCTETFDLLRYIAFAYSFEGSIPTKRNTLSLPAGRQVFREIESFGRYAGTSFCEYIGEEKYLSATDLEHLDFRVGFFRRGLLSAEFGIAIVTFFPK